MVENGGEITAPISISLEFQMRSDSSLLPFYSYADYCKIEKHTISQCNSTILSFSGKIVGGEKSAKNYKNLVGKIEKIFWPLDGALKVITLNWWYIYISIFTNDINK